MEKKNRKSFRNKNKMKNKEREKKKRHAYTCAFSFYIMPTVVSTIHFSLSF